MQKTTDDIAHQLEEALLLVTPGARHFDDNLMLTVSSDLYRDLTVKHDAGRNGDNDMRFIALCSPENIKALLEERRALLAAHEQEPVACEFAGWQAKKHGGEWVTIRPEDVEHYRFNEDLPVRKIFTHPSPSIPAAVPEDARQTKNEFEAWVRFHCDEGEAEGKLKKANGGANYADSITDIAWIAWKESRAAMLKGYKS